MTDGNDEVNTALESPPRPVRGKKWLTAAIVLVFLFCTAFALYLIIAGFYWKPVSGH